MSVVVVPLIVRSPVTTRFSPTFTVPPKYASCNLLPGDPSVIALSRCAPFVPLGTIRLFPSSNLSVTSPVPIYNSELNTPTPPTTFACFLKVIISPSFAVFLDTSSAERF